MNEPGPILTLAVDIGFLLIMAAIILAVVRLARGPSLPDRVVALDLITVLAVPFAALLALAYGEAAFLDVAIALALVAFLATIAFARFAERQVNGDKTVPPREDSP